MKLDPETTHTLYWTAISFLALIVLLLVGILGLFIKAEGCGLSAVYEEVYALLPI